MDARNSSPGTVYLPICDSLYSPSYIILNVDSNAYFLLKKPRRLFRCFLFAIT